MRETSSGDSYKPGGNWGICGECGGKFRASEMRMRYDRLLVCQNDYEERHPQEAMRTRPDKIRAKVVSPEGEDTYITIPITQADL